MNEKAKQSYTELEQAYRNSVREKLSSLKSYLAKQSVHDEQSPGSWYHHLNQIKQILGNINNDVSFIATLLAKLYLHKKFGLIEFDAAEKPQGAPGLDIDIWLSQKARIVGEIKTTTPYNGPEFGAQQKTSFEKDFAKLAAVDAKYKFMFVTEDTSFKILCRPTYAAKLSGVKVVQLVSGEEFQA